MSEWISVKADIENIDELFQQLKDLGVNVRHASVGAMRYGGKAVQEQAESNARGITSQKGKLVAMRVRFRKKEDFVVASIYPAKGHAELRVIEYGTGAGRRWATKKGPFTFRAGNRKISTRMIDHPGTAARPWLRPAFDQKSDEAASRYGERLKDVIDTLKNVAEDNGDA
jgi:HK97 gp10 family phage protein